MKNLNSIGWYAARISPLLPKKVFKPVPIRLLGGLAYLIVAVSGFLTITMFNLNIWLNLGIAVILGVSYAGMGFLGHEILHGTVVRKPWIRDLLGTIAFLPLTTGAKLWREWHNKNHHVHTQDEKKDPDAWLSLEQFSRIPFLRWVYRLPFFIRALASFLSLSVTFTVHSSRMFILYQKNFDMNKRIKLWIQFVFPWVFWIGFLFLLGPLKWVFVYLLPMLIANFIVMSYISTNHRLNPLVPVNDPLANSLTVTVPRWVDILHFNFSYHTEHHVFPGMSPKYYPLVRKYIKEMWPDRYHEMPLGKALKALWKTPRIYYKNNDLIDPFRSNVYGSLGNGLNPENICPRKIDLNKTK